MIFIFQNKKMKKIIFTILTLFSIIEVKGQIRVPYVVFDITPFKAIKHKIKTAKYYTDSTLTKLLNFTPEGLVQDSIVGYDIEKNDLMYRITNIDYFPNNELKSYEYTIYFQENMLCKEFLNRHNNKEDIVKVFTEKKYLNLSVQVQNDVNKIFHIYKLQGEVIDIDTIISFQVLYPDIIITPLFKINNQGIINEDIDSLIQHLPNGIEVNIDSIKISENEIYTYTFYRNDVNNIEVEIYKIIGKEKKYVLECSIDNFHKCIYMYFNYDIDNLRLSDAIYYYIYDGINKIDEQYKYLYTPNGELDIIIFNRENGRYPSKTKFHKNGLIQNITSLEPDNLGGVDNYFIAFYYYDNGLPEKMIVFKNEKKTEELHVVYEFYP
jgi:hypothetical protein